MYVKRLQNHEILDGLHLVWEVFAEELAPKYTPQGVEEFRQFIKLENIMPKVQSGEMTLFGALEDTQLCGIGAVLRDGHISLLFVRKSCQRQGAAKLLMNAMYQYCTAQLSLRRMTVNAAPSALEAYRHMGFRETAAEQEKNGIRFVPMERMALPQDVRPRKTNGSHKGLIFGIIAAVLILVIVTGFLIGKAVSVVRARIEKNGGSGIIQEMPDGELGDALEEYFGNGDNNSEEAEDEETGIEAIDCYVEENLPYTIKEEQYTYHSNGKSGEYPMEFDVKYPQIEGLEGDKADEINQMLKECAMTTVNTLYLNPSEGMKEKMLQESNPFLASQVTYKVTYAGADFISVAFSDSYFAGNYHAGYVDLRTRNVRLSDGKIYETADIVKLNDEFMKDWKKRMKSEAPNAVVLDKLKTSEFYQILGGKILENSYYDNFFVDADGMEIGMTYHYTADAEGNHIENGWITAPFEMDEIVQYKTDSDFWNLVQSNN